MKGKEEGNDARGSSKGSEIMKKVKSEKRKTNRGCLISTSDTGGRKKKGGGGGKKNGRQYKTKKYPHVYSFINYYKSLNAAALGLLFLYFHTLLLLLSHPQTLLSITDQDRQRY